jgi:two-component system, response regulator YesN
MSFPFKFLRRPGKKSIFIRFFLSYLLVLTIPLIIGSMEYSRAYSLVQNKELDTRSILINECMMAMDSTIKKIDTSLIDLCQNPTVKKVMNLSKQPSYGEPEAALVFETCKVLSSYAVSSGLGPDLILYLDKPNLVFNSTSIVYGESRFYNTAVSYENMNFEQFKKQVLNAYHFHSVIGDINMQDKRSQSNGNIVLKHGLLYINSLPLIGSRSNIQGTAVVHISSSITNILVTIPISEYGCTYIADSKQNILAGIFGDQCTFTGGDLPLPDHKGNFNQTINGQKMLVTYVKSDYNGWIYVSMSPMNKIMGDLYSLQQRTIGISVGILLLGIVIAILLSKSNSKPFELALIELQGRLGNAVGGSFGSLNRVIHSIINDNEELTKTLGRQNSMMKISFFERLFRGEFNDEADILSMQRYLGLDLSGRAYGVCILSFGAQENDLSAESLFQRDILQIFTKSISLQQISFKVFTHILSTERIGVLVCFESDDEPKNQAALSEELLQLLGDTETKFSTPVHCSIGGFYTRLADVCLSYSEAATAADHTSGLPSPQKLLFYQDINRDKFAFFYPYEIEVKLKNMLGSGNAAGVKETLDYIWEENFVNRHISNQMAYYLVIDLQTSAVKFNQELKLDWNAAALVKIKPETVDWKTEFDRVQSAYQELTAFALAKPRNNSLIRQIEAYIVENYSNSDMSIATVAKQFYISESYFSQFFKNNTGQIFSKYLETLRINTACDLIKHTAKNIDEIALEVGYKNALSFRRAFKKVIGVPPSNYR